MMNNIEDTLTPFQHRLRAIMNGIESKYLTQQERELLIPSSNMTSDQFVLELTNVINTLGVLE